VHVAPCLDLRATSIENCLVLGVCGFGRVAGHTVVDGAVEGAAERFADAMYANRRRFQVRECGAALRCRASMTLNQRLPRTQRSGDVWIGLRGVCGIATLLLLLLLLLLLIARWLRMYVFLRRNLHGHACGRRAAWIREVLAIWGGWVYGRDGRCTVLWL